ncbi:hypothetical protein [Candidatus Berkiella aquae]|uniref:Uncharacterized protein n=1 Tax=Candidatus Berkiella aquae TaxID=295108 RepID=A0A0Q9YC10_9GAMM|nr:hypothetical protein [Candidatus Berkiella aquae]MCS5710248.1 hypothetical protein [Candidatus Berkiella aquae]
MINGINKDFQYYDELKSKAADFLSESKTKYARAVIETVKEFDLHYPLHLSALAERYAKKNVTLYTPALSHVQDITALDPYERKKIKSRNAVVHIEYFNPEHPFTNTDEPLMGLLSIEDYLKYAVNEFCLIADNAITSKAEKSFFDALASKEGFCFEMAIRSIRAWYIAHNKLQKIFSNESEVLAVLAVDLQKLNLNINEESSSWNPTLAYYISTRAPIVVSKKMSCDEIKYLVYNSSLKFNGASQSFSEEHPSLDNIHMLFVPSLDRVWEEEVTFLEKPKANGMEKSVDEPIDTFYQIWLSFSEKLKNIQIKRSDGFITNGAFEKVLNFILQNNTPEILTLMQHFKRLEQLYQLLHTIHIDNIKNEELKMLLKNYIEDFKALTVPSVSKVVKI